MLSWQPQAADGWHRPYSQMETPGLPRRSSCEHETCMPVCPSPARAACSSLSCVLSLQLPASSMNWILACLSCTGPFMDTIHTQRETDLFSELAAMLPPNLPDSLPFIASVLCTSWPLDQFLDGLPPQTHSNGPDDHGLVYIGWG